MNSCALILQTGVISAYLKWNLAVACVLAHWGPVICMINYDVLCKNEVFCVRVQIWMNKIQFLDISDKAGTKVEVPSFGPVMLPLVGSRLWFLCVCYMILFKFQRGFNIAFVYLSISFPPFFYSIPGARFPFLLVFASRSCCYEEKAV